MLPPLRAFLADPCDAERRPAEGRGRAGRETTSLSSVQGRACHHPSPAHISLKYTRTRLAPRIAAPAPPTSALGAAAMARGGPWSCGCGDFRRGGGAGAGSDVGADRSSLKIGIVRSDEMPAQQHAQQGRRITRGPCGTGDSSIHQAAGQDRGGHALHTSDRSRASPGPGLADLGGRRSAREARRSDGGERMQGTDERPILRQWTHPYP